MVRPKYDHSSTDTARQRLEACSSCNAVREHVSRSDFVLRLSGYLRTTEPESFARAVAGMTGAKVVIEGDFIRIKRGTATAP